ncbi:uncharacterized protein [Arachis hypogaea]|uniref:uncharacterized protein n=1 Tax=Arachis hypogaea TaxID=3818 RepID=UPI003B20B9BF
MVKLAGSFSLLKSLAGYSLLYGIMPLKLDYSDTSKPTHNGPNTAMAEPTTHDGPNQEVTTLSHGLVEANERIADTQAQLTNIDSSLRSIEKLLRENLKLKLKVNNYGFNGDDTMEGGSGAGSVSVGAEQPWPRLRVKVSDLPMFDGEGVEDWGIVISLGRGGLCLVPAGINNNMAYTCEAFLEAMVLRFGKNLYYDPRTAIKELKQSGSVEEYQCQFEELTNRVNGLSEEWIISLFVAGLKEPLKCESLLAQPTSYVQAVSIPKLHEQKNAVTAGLARSTGSKPITQQAPTRFAPNRTLNPIYTNQKIQTNPTSTNPANPTILHSTNTPTKTPQPPFKKLTSAEIRARREKGLCYYCDDNYAPRHRCKASYQLLIGEEELQELLQGTTEGNREVHESDTEEEEEEGEQQNPQISLNAFEGEFYPETLRVKGTHANKQLLILIDGGSTHNFIKRSIAKKLNLSLTPTPALKRYRFSTDMYVLDLKGADVVLGVHWMMRLGTIRINYMELFMKFKEMGTWITFKGERLLRETELNFKELRKLSGSSNIASLFQLAAIPSMEEPVLEVEEVAIQTVIEEFNDVFEEPKQLPPHRAIDHPINLTPGASPPVPRGASGSFSSSFTNLEKNQFFAKRSKCTFLQQHIEYLRHVISGEGVKVDPAKIEAIVAWPVPKSLKQLRGFLGLTGYYRKFVAQYAQRVFPLTELLKKNAFQWNIAADQAFHQLKQLMVHTPVLALPDFTQPFIVETDASSTGVGAILSQGGHPIAYFSKKLGAQLSQASAYVRELYAVTQAVAKWRHYLLGRKFLIRTDHQGLRELTTQVILTPEQQHYLSKLLGYEFEIEYRPGKFNKVADALSRLGDDEHHTQLQAFTAVQSNLLPTLLQANNESEEMLQLQEKLQRGTLPSEYVFKDGLMTHRGMRQDVVRFVNRCVEYQCTKYVTDKPQGLLQPLSVPAKP